MKEQDYETCINSLFVLSNSTKEESLQKLMEQLKVSKSELISMMGVVLKKNIEEYEESIKYYQNNYE